MNNVMELEAAKKSMKDWALLQPVAGLRLTIAALYDCFNSVPLAQFLLQGKNDKDFFTF